ncbi:MAG: type II secretion system F family protein [Verrucomicrobiae bacterium]|nr:type II secretion system F family protein [Verrucomicrobiae bacterium]MCB1085818.1 type II secretion system F family protein [Verrucomicrobiae bacterium]MCB1092118.1 type II secretion system F family protein [Verrucomicrobiae bacterium]
MSAVELGHDTEEKMGAAQAAKLARAAQMEKAREEKRKAGFFSSFAKKSRFPRKELIKLCRGLASMLKAQINTSDALKYYAHGHPSAEVRKTLSEAKAMIDAGAPTYVAFEKTGKFDDKFISLVRAGTDSGQIHKAFDSISHRLVKEAEFMAKMRKATILPAVIITALLGLFVVAQLKIVPQVEGLLLDVKQTPDPFSMQVFKISHIVKKTWPVLMGTYLGIGAIFLFVEKVRTFVTNLAMSKWRLLRRLIMGMRQMLFLGTLNMLHSNGINLAKSIEIAAQSLKGTQMCQEMIEAGLRYKTSGLPFSEALKKFTSCDAQVCHMVSIGERSSSLEMQLELLTNMYEEDVNQLIGEFTAAINFISLAMATVLISIVFIGAFLPIFLMGPKMMNSAM